MYAPKTDTGYTTYYFILTYFFSLPLSLAYVLDLRVRLHPPGPAPFTIDCNWRTYALQLEIELTRLREQHEVQKTSMFLPLNSWNAHVLKDISKNYLPSQIVRSPK